MTSPESCLSLNRKVGARLRESIAARTTFKSAAEKVGVTEKTLRRWMSGTSSVDAGAIILLCRSLQMDAGYILVGQTLSLPNEKDHLPETITDSRRGALAWLKGCLSQSRLLGFHLQRNAK
jgi:transcriptional regulator with XRE-family HTH domain